ncbi:hypothetical protein ACFSSB_07490 [Lacinutrix gracilariae]|uniref:Dolichyl-phosphate-mannose-protein mannosyltransferase n=1 Tax=Lacinutrix gracilariae TaxID=1747198 RepID=A0ABW5JZI1_9FLAO
MFNNYKVTEKQFKYIIISILIAVFLFVVNKPILTFKDSSGYLNMIILRSAGYPIFLYVLKKTFGAYFNLAIIILQFTFGAYAIRFLIYSLKKQYSLNNLWYILLLIILLIPYVYNQNLANVILSESLTYPLYLICTAFFITAFLEKKAKHLVLSLPVLLLLILTRSQFLFLIPVAIIILLYNSFTNKKFQNKGLLLLLIAFPFITSLLDKTYHKIVHNEFVNTPWTGIHLITPAFYVSDKEDYAIFDSEEEQLFFKNTYADLYVKHLTTNNLLDEKYSGNDISTYINKYPEIANSTIFISGKKTYNNTVNEDKQLIAIDRLTKKMTVPLILNNFKKWISIYVKNFVHAFGNAKYTLLFFVLLIFSLYQTKKESKGYKIICLLTLLTLSNVALVSIGMHTIKRFTFYNDWVIFLVIFILFNFTEAPTKKLL